MFSLLYLAATVTPTPGEEPSLRPGLDPADVTPGTLGFLATLFMVIAVIFLIRDMVKRIRRVRYRTMAEEGSQDGQSGDLEPGEGSQGSPEAPRAADPSAHPLPDGERIVGGKHGDGKHGPLS